MKLKKSINTAFVKTVERAAIKSSESISWFFLYQPETPKKLRQDKKK